MNVDDDGDDDEEGEGEGHRREKSNNPNLKGGEKAHGGYLATIWGRLEVILGVVLGFDVLIRFMDSTQ